MTRGTWVYRNGELVEKGGPLDVRPPVQRSSLPCPMVMSDAMPACEHVDGNFYDSKSAYRRVTKANGLIEVGNEKPKPRPRPKVNDQAISDAVDKAAARFSAGERI